MPSGGPEMSSLLLPSSSPTWIFFPFFVSSLAGAHFTESAIVNPFQHPPLSSGPWLTWTLDSVSHMGIIFLFRQLQVNLSSILTSLPYFFPKAGAKVWFTTLGMGVVFIIWYSFFFFSCLQVTWRPQPSLLWFHQRCGFCVAFWLSLLLHSCEESILLVWGAFF